MTVLYVPCSLDSGAISNFSVELVSDYLTRFCLKTFQTLKLDQSTRVGKVDVLYHRSVQKNSWCLLGAPTGERSSVWTGSTITRFANKCDHCLTSERVDRRVSGGAGACGGGARFKPRAGVLFEAPQRPKRTLLCRNWMLFYGSYWEMVTLPRISGGVGAPWCFEPGGWAAECLVALRRVDEALAEPRPRLVRASSAIISASQG